MKLNSTRPEHKKHVVASQARGMTYNQVITNILLDPELNLRDEEDSQFLMSAFFGLQETLHISYAKETIQYIKNNKPYDLRLIKAIAALANFWEDMLVLYLEDIFRLFSDQKEIPLLEIIFSHMNNFSKHYFIKYMLKTNPELLCLSDKFKLYAVFS